MKKNDFIIVRHSYDDHSYIDGKNNTGLTQKGIEMMKEASGRILKNINSNDVIIRHSTKKRAEESAEILAEDLLKRNINCQCISDNGFTELFQGNFNFGNMEHKERVDFLQSCWDDFEYCRKTGDLKHHFGQNKSSQIVLNPGENHLEWSIRIASGVLNIINDLKKSYQSISITHRGAIFEIQKIIEMINNGLPMELVEQYETIWISYCQEYLLHFNDLDSAEVMTKKYIYKRSKDENNY